MSIGTTKHPSVGKRVEVPAYSDLWMRGARFGIITRVKPESGRYLQPGDPRGAALFIIRMDHPQVRKLATFVADDCRYTGD